MRGALRRGAPACMVLMRQWKPKAWGATLSPATENLGTQHFYEGCVFIDGKMPEAALLGSRFPRLTTCHASIGRQSPASSCANTIAPRFLAHWRNVDQGLAPLAIQFHGSAVLVWSRTKPGKTGDTAHLTGEDRGHSSFVRGAFLLTAKCRKRHFWVRDSLG